MNIWIPKFSRSVIFNQKYTSPLIYDFYKHPIAYKARCKPIIDKMIETNLINEITTNEIYKKEEIRKYMYDYTDAKNYNYDNIIKLLVDEINDCGYDNIDFTDINKLSSLAKIILFERVLYKNFPNGRIFIDISVSNTKKILFSNNDNPEYFTRYDDYINFDENIGSALSRIMSELSLDINTSRIIMINQQVSYYTYKLNITLDEYEDWKTKIKTSKLKPKITQICFERIKPEKVQSLIIGSLEQRNREICIDKTKL